MLNIGSKYEKPNGNMYNEKIITIKIEYLHNTYHCPILTKKWFSAVFCEMHNLQAMLQQI